MPTSATGRIEPRAAPGRARGFTLLELLVTLTVIGIAVASVSLALRPDERRQLRDEAERLALLLEQAGEEVALRGATIAWVAREHDYEFQRRDVTSGGIDWRVLRGDDLLRPRALPAGMRIDRVALDGRPLPAGERLVLEDEAAVSLAIELSLGVWRARIEPDASAYQARVYQGGD